MNPQGHVTVYKDPAHIEKIGTQKPTIPSGFFAKPADTMTPIAKDLTKEQEILNKTPENTNDKNNTPQTPTTSTTPVGSSPPNENQKSTSIFSNALSLVAKQSESNANTVVVPGTSNSSVGENPVKNSFTLALSSTPSFSFVGNTSVLTPPSGGCSLGSTETTKPSM